ncbi:MAG: hypothetical protein LUB59_05615, partial [Candidatus Gastranaerophilales bacterium]|nr:hypothetical protein [Candidatus Gastranaerophilales bacterium]
MSSNNINTSSNENSTLIQISNNNVKYYEELAEQYAKSAEKSLSECAAYLSSAQRCITECQNVKDSMTVSLDDMLGEHTDNLDNPHEVTAEQIDTYTKSEIDTILVGQTVNLSTYYTAVEVDAIAAEKQDNLTAGVD